MIFFKLFLPLALSASPIYSGLTFCYWASIQLISLSDCVTEWPPDRHILSSLELEVIIIQILHFRIPVVDLLGATFSFQVTNKYDCQS